MAPAVLVPFRIGSMSSVSRARLGLVGRPRGNGAMKVPVTVGSWRQDDL